MVEFLEGLQFNREEIESLDDIAEIVQSKEDATRYVTRIFRKALEIREKAASNRYGDIVDEVMRYIEKNYADDELSLNSVASHVNFSPNHLSMIFSQQTGGTFSKYLTDFRMNKAKELLRCTGKRSSVISMEVGYKDPHYFSYLFKKTQGMTPKFAGYHGRINHALITAVYHPQIVQQKNKENHNRHKQHQIKVPDFHGKGGIIIKLLYFFLHLVVSFRIFPAAVLGRCHPLRLFKQIGKIMRIFIPYFHADNAAPFPCTAKQFFCLVHPDLFDAACADYDFPCFFAVQFVGGKP